MEYHFEDVRTNPYDTNWLLIDGRARWGSVEWNSLEPCPLVDEARSFGTWWMRAVRGLDEPLELTSENKLQPTLSHVEPDLGFGLVSFNPAAVVIRALLWLESQPPSVMNGREFFMDPTLSPSALRQAAAEWEHELADFPQRA